MKILLFLFFVFFFKDDIIKLKYLLKGNFMKNDILDLGLGKKIQNYRLNKKFTIKKLYEKNGMTSYILIQI